MIKELFRHKRPGNLAIAPPMGNDWYAHTGACRQTLEGHDGSVNPVVFSHDSSRLAGSSEKTIKTWDAQTAAYLQTVGTPLSIFLSMPPSGLFSPILAPSPFVTCQQLPL